jgi:hypothetical protein
MKKCLDGFLGNNLLPRLYLSKAQNNIASTSASPRSGDAAVKTVPVIEEMKNPSGKA